ncbi:hypothetical protein ACFSKW_05265 [Nonomuraea mangrovi]|uniref:DUF1700 domain-containing protein n=1 Tax=Nonomuraea mangrovi TaxID=2316207 RepID=A0ABW4SN33_9ACTN
MAGHELIDTQLGLLAARLPPQVVEELADGLHEAYEARLAIHNDPDQAARAALADFGDADTITASFMAQSPWRRAATVLLLTGPLMAAAWATTLLSVHAWAWSLPIAVKVGYGAALLAVVAVLIAVVREKRAYRRTRTLLIGSATTLIVLDMLALTALSLLAAGPGWPMLLAIPASVIRILAIMRSLPGVLTV